MIIAHSIFFLAAWLDVSDPIAHAIRMALASDNHNKDSVDTSKGSLDSVEETPEHLPPKEE